MSIHSPPKMYSYAKLYIPSLSRKLVPASIMEANFRDKYNEDKSGVMKFQLDATWESSGFVLGCVSIKDKV